MLLKQYFNNRPRSGFTLLELLLATSIGSLIVFVSFSFLRNISSDFSTARSRQSLQDQSSAALDLIATEVRSSRDFYIPFAKTRFACYLKNVFLLHTGILVFNRIT